MDESIALNFFLGQFFSTMNVKEIYLRGNIAHHYVNVKDFFTNKKDWKISLFYKRNRPIDEERVRKISQRYSKNREKFGRYTFFGQIIIGIIQGSDPRILDGQHRLAALENTSEDNEFMLVTINYDSEEERFEGFKEINSNLSLPEMYKSSSDLLKDIASLLADELLKLSIFKPYICNGSDRNGEPSINKIKLVEKLFEILPSVRVDEDQLIKYSKEKIVDYNNLLDKTFILASYPIYPLKVGYCIAQASKDNILQCEKLIRYQESKKCGVHHSAKTSNCYPENLRQVLYNKIKNTKSFVLMFKDYEWIKNALLTGQESKETFSLI